MPTDASAAGPDPAHDVGGSLLEVDHLSVFYESRRGGARPAVHDVSFAIARGEILALVGESGCGKTSVARAVPRLVPARGSVRLDGCDLLNCSRAGLRRGRRQLGMVFQDPVASLNPKRRVADIVAEPLRATGRAGDHRASVRAALALVGLLDAAADPARGWGTETILHRRPAELSGGQCQRVSLARALVASPRLLVCDEATSALDAHNRAVVLQLLAGYRQQLGLAVLFITHDLGAAWQLADRVAVMHQGRIVETGPPGRVFGHPAHHYTRSLMAAVPTGQRRAVVPTA